MALKPTTYNLRPTTKKFGRIGVLMGGSSSEREISLKSGRAICLALKEINLNTVPIDITTADRKENARLIMSHKINSAFLALHGRFGEDGQIQEILDSLGIAYTGSGKLASKLAMDKIASRRIFKLYGLNVPTWWAIEKISYNPNWLWNNNFSFPVVVKPAGEGSSIGLSIVDKKEDLEQAINLAFQFDQWLLIEEYIKGRELTVGILDQQALPVIEIIPKKRFFDYEAKYTAGLTDYVVPAKLQEDLAQRIQSAALAAHKFLGCYGYSRVDLILDERNAPFILEVNTTPGFTAMSLFPKAAKVIGLDFAQLCLKLLKLAHEKA